MGVRYLPQGYHTATPYLIVKGASRAIEFYQQAFAAKELMRLPGPGGMIGHAEIMIGDSPILLADEMPEMGYRSPESWGGTPVSILLYVEDVDMVVERSVKAGAKLERPAADQFYGDRNAILRDPFGHVWTIATHQEDVSVEEMEQRARNRASAE
jgi:PhnB protein